MSEMLNRVAAFGGDNGACGAAVLTRRKLRHPLAVLPAVQLTRRKLQLLLAVLPAVQLTRTRSKV